MDMHMHMHAAGVWELLSSQTVVDLVATVPSLDPQKICDKIVEQARGYTDTLLTPYSHPADTLLAPYVHPTDTLLIPLLTPH